MVWVATSESDDSMNKADNYQDDDRSRERKNHENAPSARAARFFGFVCVAGSSRSNGANERQHHQGPQAVNSELSTLMHCKLSIAVESLNYSVCPDDDSYTG